MGRLFRRGMLEEFMIYDQISRGVGSLNGASGWAWGFDMEGASSLGNGV